MSAHHYTHCYAEPGAGHIIDGINPDTGLTLINNETYEQIKERYPAAVLMEIEAFLAEKYERNNAPVRWEEVTQEQYDEMLCVLPPAVMLPIGFMVGEPCDHCAKTGRPRFQAYTHKGGKYFAASRPMTVAEFKTVNQEGVQP